MKYGKHISVSHKDDAIRMTSHCIGGTGLLVTTGPAADYLDDKQAETSVATNLAETKSNLIRGLSIGLETDSVVSVQLGCVAIKWLISLGNRHLILTRGYASQNNKILKKV